jgi:Zn-dependent protease
MLDMLPGIVLGLTLHEFAHAFAAFKLGDSTARDQGRVSLNPLEHIDLLGLALIFLIGFGWAKPVQIDYGKLRRPRRDAAIVAAAGPLANGLLALLASAAYAYAYGGHGVALSGIAKSLESMLLLVIYGNWGLFVFNLIPFPPLDGSHIVFGGLRKNPEFYAKFTRFGVAALFIVLFLQNRTGIDILPIGRAVNWLSSSSLSLFGYR